MAIEDFHDQNQIIGDLGGSGRQVKLITRDDYVREIIHLQREFYELLDLPGDEINSKMEVFKHKIIQLGNIHLKNYYSEIKSRCDELKAKKETAAQEKQEALFNEILNDYIFTIVPDLVDNPDILVVNENMNNFSPVTSRQLDLSGLTSTEGLIIPDNVGKLSFEDEVELQLLVDPLTRNPAALAARRQDKNYFLKSAISLLWSEIYDLQRKLGVMLSERSGSNDKLFAGFVRKLEEMDTTRLKKLYGVLTKIRELKKSQLKADMVGGDVYNSLLGELDSFSRGHGGR